MVWWGCRGTIFDFRACSSASFSSNYLNYLPFHDLSHIYIYLYYGFCGLDMIRISFGAHREGTPAF